MVINACLYSSKINIHAVIGLNEFHTVYNAKSFMNIALNFPYCFLCWTCSCGALRGGPEEVLRACSWWANPCNY